MSDQIFNDLPDILDATQIAAALRIARAGVYNLLSSEDFPTLHIGRRKLVMKNDLIQWLKSHTNTTPKHDLRCKGWFHRLIHIAAARLW